MKKALSVFALFSAGLAAEETENFQGTWKLETITGTTAPANLLERIQQAQDGIEIASTWDAPANGQLGLTLVGITTPSLRLRPGGETSNEVGPFTQTAKSYWQGGRLVTEWRTNEFQGHSFRGRWVRSVAGDAMTVEIETVSGGKTASAVLVFRAVNRR